jgi:dihydrodipicolinate synthase/N-acetylneuraminate lyase
VHQLAVHPNIIGIKESSGNVEKIAQLVAATRKVHFEVEVTEVFAAVTRRMKDAAETTAEGVGGLVTLQSSGGGSAVAAPPKPKKKTRTKDAGFQVLCGAAHALLPSLEAGAVGAVLGFAAPAPTACFEIFTAWKDRDPKLAAEKQGRISVAAKRVVSEFGVPGIKFAQELNGYYGGPPRLPLLPLVVEQKQEIERLMKEIRS